MLWALAHKHFLRVAVSIDSSKNGEYIRNRRNVWTVPTKTFKGTHFATFPFNLIRPYIMVCCPENGVVLDPFMGDSTTALLVACECSCNYIGIELNAEYVKIAEK